MHFDRDGKPLDGDTWSSLKLDYHYGRVAHDVVAGVSVSTVWIGINQNFTGHGPPLIFETLIRGGTRDYEQIRYSTEAEAMAGHTRVIMDLHREQKRTS